MTSGQGDWPDFRQGSGYKITSLIDDIHPSVLGDLAMYLQANLNQIISDISQVPGYTAQTPYTATSIGAQEATTSTSFIDLTTVGPSLSSLPDGTYMVTFGAIAVVSAATARASMGISINGGAVDTTKVAETNSTLLVGIALQTSYTLSAGGSNSIVAKYRVNNTNTVTATFANRYLTAVRMAGP